ncbi:MAG: hypothetical protein LAO19_10840 [Acidobacteriia bacterium]|nr:hypothetical protein [Terriglobia bacterium]
MRIISFIACGLLFVLLSPVTPVMAHHGFAVEFDQNKPITLAGVVTKMEFMNPHIYFYVDVKSKDGKVTNWSFEGGPPNVLYRQGWRKDTVKPGDTVTVKGFRAKDGTNLASCTSVTFPDGREVSAGPKLGSSGGYGSGTNNSKK